MTLRNTGNIYNDLSAYKHRDIAKAIKIMKLNSNKDSFRTFHNSKINLGYELSIKLHNELDSRKYPYKTLSEVLTASYFIKLLTDKEGYNTITDYRIYTTIKDGKNRIILEDTTDNVHYWHSIFDNELRQKERQLEEQLTELELYKKFIVEYKAEKQFQEWKEKKNNFTNIHWYELKFRSPSPGCQPKDFVEIDNNKGKWGIVGYNRELSQKELSDYEMKIYVA